MADGIQFKDQHGRTATLAVTTSIGQRDASPDDMARAYHAMTNEQVEDMAAAWARLPKGKNAVTRWFGDSILEKLDRLERELAQARSDIDVLRSAVHSAASASENGEYADWDALRRALEMTEPGHAPRDLETVVVEAVAKEENDD